MWRPLPYAYFQWVDWNENESLVVRNVSVNGDINYILQVILHYSDRQRLHLHDLHSDYSLIVVRQRVTPGVLSPY